MTTTPPRYQDFVIKDGQLVGDFEGLYKTFEDPWQQSQAEQVHDSRRCIAINWMRRLRADFGANRAIELGCGFGHMTNTLRQDGFSAVGVDISDTAIAKARAAHPQNVFVQGSITDFDLLAKFDPDVLILAEITWYVLDELDAFLSWLRARAAQRAMPVFLIHLLTTYAPGVQQYGRDKFTNLDEILNYFGLDILEAGHIRTPRKDDPDSQGTYFVGCV